MASIRPGAGVLQILDLMLTASVSTTASAMCFSRQYSPTLLKTFDFKGAPNSQPLLKAIDLLRTLDESGKRKVPATAPRGFVRPKWQPHVFPPHGGIVSLGTEAIEKLRPLRRHRLPSKEALPYSQKAASGSNRP